MKEHFIYICFSWLFGILASLVVVINMSFSGIDGLSMIPLLLIATWVGYGLAGIGMPLGVLLLVRRQNSVERKAYWPLLLVGAIVAPVFSYISYLIMAGISTLIVATVPLNITLVDEQLVPVVPVERMVGGRVTTYFYSGILQIDNESFLPLKLAINMIVDYRLNQDGIRTQWDEYRQEEIVFDKIIGSTSYISRIEQPWVAKPGLSELPFSYAITLDPRSTQSVYYPYVVGSLVRLDLTSFLLMGGVSKSVLLESHLPSWGEAFQDSVSRLYSD